MFASYLLLDAVRSVLELIVHTKKKKKKKKEIGIARHNYAFPFHALVASAVVRAY